MGDLYVPYLTFLILLIIKKLENKKTNGVLGFWGFEVFCDLFNFGKGNLFKIYQIFHFLARSAQILGVFEFIISISLPVC